MSSMPASEAYKEDFWNVEQQKFAAVHYRLRKTARIVNRILGDRMGTVLDVGCGPGVLGSLLSPGVMYYGLDLVVPQPAPNLRQVDLTESPIEFGDLTFDVVIAQGLFEYLGGHQSTKFAEVRRILAPGGRVVITYVNFDHRRPYLYPPYSNVQPHEAFRASLEEHFVVEESFPTAYNWIGSEPNRRWLQALNMPCRLNIPLVGKRLAVEYFFVGTARP